jgi:hypothetical protein
VSNSQHTEGKARDTNAVGISVSTYYNLIREMVEKSIIDFDQCINEFGHWVHISYNKDAANRKQFLLAVIQDGKKIYLPNKI